MAERTSIRTENLTAEHGISGIANRGFSAARSIAGRLRLHRQVRLRIGLTRTARGSAFSTACLLMMACVGPVAATDDGSRPVRHIAMAATKGLSANQVSIHSLERGFQSGIHEPLQIVVRAPAEWKALWQRHASTQSKVPPAPTVDFNKEIVVGVFLGDKPTGGYQVEILRAERSDGTLLIYFDEQAPGTGAMVIQVITQPFHIVRVAANGIGAVGFRRVP